LCSPSDIIKSIGTWNVEDRNKMFLGLRKLFPKEFSDKRGGLDEEDYSAEEFNSLEIYVGPTENELSPNHVIFSGEKNLNNFEPIELHGITLVIECHMPTCTHKTSLVVLNRSEEETIVLFPDKKTNSTRICVNGDGVLVVDKKTLGDIFQAYIPVIMSDTVAQVGNNEPSEESSGYDSGSESN